MTPDPVSAGPAGSPARYLVLSDDALLDQCDVHTFRASGPGGQHRNKTDTGVRIFHRSTRCTAQATERRSQHQNRVRALQRLRERIALDCRAPIDLEAYEPPDALLDILPLQRGGRRGAPRVGRGRAAYWLGVQALLDLFVAERCAVAPTATRVGCTTAALARFLLADRHLGHAVNALRAERGLGRLR